KPEPKPEPPKPEPKPEPKPDPDIALEKEKERKRQEELKRKEEEARKAKEEAERKKKEEERKKAEAERKKKEAERKKKEEAERKKREEQYRREIAEAERKRMLAELGEAVPDAPPSKGPLTGAPTPGDPTARAAYVDKIRAKIRSNIVLPPDIPGNPEAQFDVTQLPTGEVVSVTLRKSSGVTSYDIAVERAIWKSSPLPPPERRELFERQLNLRFRPV